MNLSYLRRFDNNPLPGLATDAESPDPVITGEDSSADEFEVTHILDSGINRQYCGSRLQFLVSWHGWPDNPTWYNVDDGELSHTKDALDKFYTLPSTVVRRPHFAEVSPLYPPADKSRAKPFFPEGVVLRATGPLHVPYTLHNPYKHLSHAPKPVTLHSPSCTHTLVQVTSLNPNYLTLLLCLSILSRTQHEPLTSRNAKTLRNTTLYIVLSLVPFFLFSLSS